MAKKANVVEKIESTDESWETRALGADEEFVQKSSIKDLDKKLDSALDMQLTSIRLPKSLIEDLKIIAELYGYRGYQTLIKRNLVQYAECEKKNIMRQMRDQKRKEHIEDNHENEEVELPHVKAG